MKPAENATAIDAEIPEAEAGAAVQDQAGAVAFERDDLGAHPIGKAQYGRALDVEAAPGARALRPQQGARLTAGEGDPGAPEFGCVDSEHGAFGIGVAGPARWCDTKAPAPGRRLHLVKRWQTPVGHAARRSKSGGR